MRQELHGLFKWKEGYADMLKQKRIAIMGAGNIAGIMAKTIKKMKHVKCYAIASRDLGRAKEFAKKYGVKKAYGSYEEMVQDSKIDLVYIATPHSEHYQNMKLCIEYGKPVLCEKAFTANAEQAEEVFRLAKEKGVFVTEAIWTRYMPFLSSIRGILSSGIIGTPSMLTCNLGYHLVHVPRMMQPELAGGALLDLGVYTLNFASMLFGDIFFPKSSISPLSYESRDKRQFIVVVFPEPFGPRRPNISPSLISRLKCSKASTSLYLFTIFSIFTTV